MGTSTTHSDPLGRPNSNENLNFLLLISLSTLKEIFATCLKKKNLKEQPNIFHLDIKHLATFVNVNNTNSAPIYIISSEGKDCNTNPDSIPREGLLKDDERMYPPSEGVDLPKDSEFLWSTAILFISNFPKGVDQEIVPDTGKEGICV